MAQAERLSGSKNVDVASMAIRFVRAARDRAKLNRTDFARRCGLKVSALEYIENNRIKIAPSLKTLALVAFAAGAKRFAIKQDGEVIFQIDATKSRSFLLQQIFTQTQNLVVQTRNKVGISQSQFGEKRNINLDAIYELERRGTYQDSKPVRLETLIKILGGDVEAITLGFGD